jgi:hypothetical protein
VRCSVSEERGLDLDEEQDIGGESDYLYLSSTSLALISDYSDEPSLAVRPDGRRESVSPVPVGGNSSSGGGGPGKVVAIRDSLYVVIPMTLVYSLILLTGLLGNVSTCIVIAKNNYMHTATNYYLFSLAISDLLLLLSGLPQV